ncbi:hypothetical protein Thimo_2362 [Thioflavicoccus mobilis 8321]|uniref:Flavinylation-associated cytochrome domain-containing protein n=1 Tax=Thioflavicoccus mobilis 8321 TaxID=765912 RepID=L0H0I4_9GAMM|nr:DUF4405 domain-containing protein [Thioflavicoccus mobilis]AGA91099.1 hypothetical protein Thimo_2362 [Thioflavicoccus mobilis 8321]
MINLNTRQWSTPAVVAAGIFVAVSGVLMLFGVHGPLKHAHEWIGLAFAVAIGFHIATHWRGMKSYFSQRAALSIVAAVALASVGLMLTPPNHDGDHGRHRSERNASRVDADFESAIATVNPDQAQADAIRQILDDEATRAAHSRYLAYRQILGVLNEDQRGRYTTLIQQQFVRQLDETATALHLTADQKAELGAVLTRSDDSLQPSAADSDLSEALRGILTDDQIMTLATRLWQGDPSASTQETSHL